MTTPVNFTHLKLKTEYSICKGSMFLSDSIALAKSRGESMLGVCDDENLFGSLEFAKYCLKSSIKPVIGCVSKIRYGETSCNISFFAKDDTGYKNLLYLTSSASINSSWNGVIPFEELKAKSQGLIALSGSGTTHIAKFIETEDFKSLKAFVEQMALIFSSNDRFYIELQRYGLHNQKLTEDIILPIAQQMSIPVVATNNIYFKEKTMHQAQDVLSCISQGRYLIETDRPKTSEEEYFKTKDEMVNLFSDIPSALENAFNIAVRCNSFPVEKKPMLPRFSADLEKSENQMLKESSITGLEERIAKWGIAEGFTREDYFNRLDYELSVIERMGFAGYFLIISDFIKWSKCNDVSVGPGRGSGAGSIIAWALSITELDPLYYGLLFERFLNPDRISMPDFDIDFCQENRFKVINYVQNKYGSGNVASIITFGKLQARAALKDVGRVLQFHYGEVDRICKMVPFNPVDPVTLQKAINMDPDLRKSMEDDEGIKRMVEIALQLEGLNRHTSTHAAGIVISDKPLIEEVPLYKHDGDEMPAVGYNMKVAEMAGLVKFDFLGLKTLTIISNACKLIKKHFDANLDPLEIPTKDHKTFEMLRAGFTRGVFQLDSVVCRTSMKQMHLDRIEDIIALTSLNRPGPMENIPSYINRKIGKEEISYPHELLKTVLDETYGIIIYQEQVMKVAQVLANYSLGQADLLRRAMGKKIKEEMDKQREVFVSGCLTNNIQSSKASEIFDLIEKFAGYGFNKSHAAAYSVISYQTAYIKAHYPICFFVSFLNIDINDTDSINLFISEARDFKIEILLPNINTSCAKFEIKDGKISYSLAAIKAVGLGAMEELESIRQTGGNFKDIFDFCKRVGQKIANKRAIENLAKCGAFDTIHDNRKQIVENVETLTSFASDSSKQDADNGLFFGSEQHIHTMPKLKEVKDYEAPEKLFSEFEAVGFYLSSHPLLQYKPNLEEIGVIWSASLSNLDSNKSKKIRMAGVVSVVRQRSGKKGRFAFLHISDIDGVFECSVFNSDLITQKRDLFSEGAVIGLEVLIQRTSDDDSFKINVSDMYKIDEFLTLSPLQRGSPTQAKNIIERKRVQSNTNQTNGKPDYQTHQTTHISIKSSVTTHELESQTESIDTKNNANHNEIIIDSLDNISNVKLKIKHLLTNNKQIVLRYKGRKIFITN